MQMVKLQYFFKRNTDAHPDILYVSTPSLHDHSYRNLKEIKQVKWNDMKWHEAFKKCRRELGPIHIWSYQLAHALSVMQHDAKRQ